MKIPSIYDFDSAMAVMILKNLAHLKHKEKYGQLTPQEINMIYDTVHHHELCMYYHEASCFEPLFTGRHEITMNFSDYAESIVRNKYSLLPEEVQAAVDMLLDETYQTLHQTINSIQPNLMETPFGDVILCKDLSKEAEISLSVLDRYYIGFAAFFMHQIQCGISSDIIVDKINMTIRSYMKEKDCFTIRMPNPYHYDTDKLISEKAKEIYTQLTNLANYGGNIYA